MSFRCLVCFSLFNGLTACASFKHETNISAVPKKAGEVLTQNSGSLACAVVEYFQGSKPEVWLDEKLYEFDYADPEYIFYGDETNANTNCHFSTGEVMPWRELKRQNISRVCFSRDFSIAALVVQTSIMDYEHYYFKNLNGALTAQGAKQYTRVYLDAFNASRLHRAWR